MLQRLLDAGIVLWENGAYCFYSNSAVVVLGSNCYIAEQTLPYHPELYTLYRRFFQEHQNAS